MVRQPHIWVRLQSVCRTRSPGALVRFFMSRIVRLTCDLVFEYDLASVPDTDEPPMVGRIVTIDRDGLSSPELSPILDQVLCGDNAIYRPGLEKNDLAFACVDDGGTVLHFSFVQFESRYKTILSVGPDIPLFTNCWTAPEARGKRLYPSTLKFACRALAARSHAMAVITCEPDNIASVKGIEHAGFELTRRVDSLVFLSRLAIQRIAPLSGRHSWRLILT